MCMVLCQEFEKSLPSRSLLSNYGGIVWQPIPVFLPGESHRLEEPGGLQSTGSQRVGHD